MKHLLTTIATVVLVGCGEWPKDIWEAAAKGNIVAVKQHLAAGADVNAVGGLNEWTPLYYAVGKDHKEIVELLITKGADVNAKDDSGWTPLHWAASWGSNEVAELLIAKGADVNAKNVVGITPLDRAITFGSPKTAALLRKHGGKTGDWFKAGESIHIAASVGHIEAVKQHLADGADVNADGRMSPLHKAAWGSHKETAELLIASGADVNAKGWNGMTPLHSAAVYGHTEVAELLIFNGTDVNAKHDDGLTPLDVAIGLEQPETADLLRKHGGKTGEELNAEGK